VPLGEARCPFGPDALGEAGRMSLSRPLQQAEYYIAIRKTAIEQGCPKLTDEERDRQAVNIDAEV
jgi:hypothetical protein